MAMVRQRDALVKIEDRRRGDCLGPEDRPIGNVAVPLDERGNSSTSPKDDLEEFPDCVGDRPVVTIDQQEVAFVVGLLGMTGEMDLTDAREWKIRQILKCRETVIGCGCKAFVDTDQQPPSSSLNDCAC